MMRFSLPILVLSLAVAAGLDAQTRAATNAATSPLVAELTTLLQQHKLDTIASRMDGDTFVAAMYIPGSELLVVSAKYAAPPLINEKILNKQYRDAYVDLSTASIIESKVLVEDLNADGLKATRAKGDPFDVVTRGAGTPMSFDGDWKKRSMSQDAYMEAFGKAETDYSLMLKALVAELKK